jgi:hypothetical protein
MSDQDLAQLAGGERASPKDSRAEWERPALQRLAASEAQMHPGSHMEDASSNDHSMS